MRADAHLVETLRGAAFLTHRGAISLAGESIYRWIERLTPYLDGRYSLAQLTTALPPERAALVEQIVTMLLDSDVLREVRDGQPHGLAAGLLDTYRSEIGFIECFRESAESTFEQYRNGVVAVVGAGPLLTAAVNASFRSGLATVHAILTAECPTDVSRWNASRQGAPRRDSGQQLEQHAVGSDDAAELLGWLSGVDLVAHVSSRPMVSRAGLLDQFCAQRRIPLVHALVAGDEAWLSTAGCPHGSGSGWWSGWQRRIALQGPGWAGSAAAEAGSASNVTTTQAAIVANHLIHSLFRHTTGTHRRPDWPGLNRIVLDTLHGELHDFLPHPFAAPVTPQSESEFLARIAALDAGEPLPEEEFSQRAAALVNGQLGIFGDITERDITQLPLSVSRTTVSDPVSLLGADAPRPVAAGAGHEFATARYRTALLALGSYGSLMVDPGRLLTSDGRALLPAGHDRTHALAQLRSGELEGWMRALRLSDGRPVLLPAAAVFPALRAAVVPYATPCGVAAAYSWSGALIAGLVQHCRRLTITEYEAAPARVFPLVDLGRRPPDKHVDDCIAMLVATGQLVTIHDITGDLGVPTFACFLGQDFAAYGCGVSALEALQDGLQQLLLCYQARVNDEPAYAPTEEPARPPRPAAADARELPTDPVLDSSGLVARLARGGRQPVAIPLDHDPEVHQVMPYVVRVLLLDA
ncbi:MAG: hypothetical protein DLM59_04505 [Pseudonocardiales bacterium]|nr:MAG: hypothetical protein DLM59_04505 [Pseudonocardiales bacterium]